MIIVIRLVDFPLCTFCCNMVREIHILYYNVQSGYVAKLSKITAVLWQFHFNWDMIFVVANYEKPEGGTCLLAIPKKK